MMRPTNRGWNYVWAIAVFGVGSLVVAGYARPFRELDYFGVICFGSDRTSDSKARAFAEANATAMKKMMADMRTKPVDDIDRAFVEMMVPHHQGAIDMAKAELRYGKNERLKRMAQEIVVTQQQEIVAMRLALETNGATSPRAPETQVRSEATKANFQ